MNAHRRARAPSRRLACATGLQHVGGSTIAVALSLAACTVHAQIAPPGDGERERRCAAATLAGSERLHEAFGRGCIAKRSFVASPPPAATAGSSAAPLPSQPADGVFRLAPVEVFASPDLPADPPPRLEQRFAAALDAGNPEVAGGKIRHGAYYAHGVYWGSDPLSFLYLNLRYGLFDP
jgi:hypothetical protein